MGTVRNRRSRSHRVNLGVRVNDLLKRRQWLLLREAAEYLSAGIGQQVDVADILRFALDGQLDLSVHLEAPVAAYGNRGQPHKIAGLCELVLEDSARDEIEHVYRVERHRPTKEIRSFSGAQVKQRDHVYQLPSSLYPPSSLPSGTVLAVKTAVLDEFIRQHLPPKPRQQADTEDLGRRERITLLVIIGSLAKNANIDISQPFAAADVIEKLTIDLKARVSARTIGETLKKVPEALQERHKISD